MNRLVYFVLVTQAILKLIGVRAGFSGGQGLQNFDPPSDSSPSSGSARYGNPILGTCTGHLDAFPSYRAFESPADFTRNHGCNVTRAPYFSPEIRKQFEQEILRSRITPQIELESSISYFPNETEYLKRLQWRLQSDSLETEVPSGWPRAVEGTLAWQDDRLNDDDEFVHHLTPAELSDVDNALENFRTQELPVQAVNRSNFPLPRLGHSLEKIQEGVHNGFGFSIIRGLDIRKYDPNDRAVVFLGISSYIAEHRGPQDRRGTMLKHIMDDERKESQTDLPFHTDVTCDVIALMTVQCSDHGGKSTIAPAWKVYNELAATRPDIIHTLAKPHWPFDTFRRDPAYYYRAPLYFHDGKIIFNFSRRLLIGHPRDGRTAGVPKLSDVQAEAIDAVHFTARKHRLTVPMEEGDIRFINNRRLLHGREWFHDSDTSAESRRHVMRLWLRDADCRWSLPPALKLAWARIFDDPHRPVRWNVEPTFEDGEWQGRGHRNECD